MTHTIEGVLTFPIWAPLISDGAGSTGIGGTFRPMILLTDLSDLDGDALVGDPCPAERHVDADATAFLRAGFRLGLGLAIATGVGIRLLSNTLGNLWADTAGGVEVVLMGAICGRGRGGVEGYGWYWEEDGKGSCKS
jgi:hypothetical protein